MICEKGLYIENEYIKEDEEFVKCHDFYFQAENCS